MNAMNKQYNINKKDLNFANILNFADKENFAKICDYCDNVFEADLVGFNFNVGIRCPICFSLYYKVYNELNDFWYLEFVKNPEDAFVCEPNPLSNNNFLFS